MNNTTTDSTPVHGLWSSKLAFVLAATGSAVGLGNIWKFPYVAGENGGGAFVLIYLLCVFSIGLPLMMAEILMGRRGGLSPVRSFSKLAREAGGGQWWRLIGFMGILTGFIILSFYSVVGGWAMAYVKMALSNGFSDIDGEQAGALLGALLGDRDAVVFWHSLFMVITIVIVAAGVKAGLERAVKLFIPALFMLLIGLVIYGAIAGDFERAVSFLFTPDFSKITISNVLNAMGLAFFSLSLGMGAIMMYGAYLPKNTSIPFVSLTVVISDTLVALIAGLAIFPFVFAHGLDAGESVGLVFVTVPLAFSQVTGGAVLLVVFFVLLMFAAITSAISLLEPTVAWAVEKLNTRRIYVAVAIGLAIWGLGLLSALSFNSMNEASLCAGFFAEQAAAGKAVPEMCDGANDLFDFFDKLTSNVMLPLGGLMIALFVGMRMYWRHTREELAIKRVWLFRLWFYMVRYVIPFAIGLIFLNAIGLLPWILELFGLAGTA